MRLKTSLYIDEDVDLRIGERAECKSKSKSAIISTDLERFYLLLDLGLKELDSKNYSEIEHEIMKSMNRLTGLSAKANFIISGNMQSENKKIKEIIKTLSPSARLAIIDRMENER